MDSPGLDYWAAQTRIALERADVQATIYRRPEAPAIHVVPTPNTRSARQTVIRTLERTGIRVTSRPADRSVVVDATAPALEYDRCGGTAR